MYVLGIETSCDETGASVVYSGKKICSNVVASSIKLHLKYGGVIPEIASRAQLEYINIVVDRAIKEAGIKIRDLNLIAVTKGPGLIGSLLVGISFAKALSLANKIPIIGIDHVKAHLYAPFLRKANGDNIPKFPFVGLVVSGGHTSLFFWQDFDNYTILGETLDDAAGEAFDKVAKLLELGYPGGPRIEKIAQRGDSTKYNFNCSSDNLNFSFSGIKTAILYKVRDICKKGKLTSKCKSDLAASFQRSVISALVGKAMSAILKKKVKNLVVGGGVVANKYFRAKLRESANENGVKVFISETKLCADNAAMIAGLGYQLYRKGKRDSLNFRPVLY
jgi:N6-L-threonylcarbamoyladenine synthase